MFEGCDLSLSNLKFKTSNLNSLYRFLCTSSAAREGRGNLQVVEPMLCGAST